MRLFRQKVRPRKEILQERIRIIKRGLFKKSTLLFLTAVFFFLILLISFGFKRMMLTSDYFKIAKVDVLIRQGLKEVAGNIDEVDSWKIFGQNIFEINLKALKFKIEKAHPEFKDIQISRILPSQLKISMTQRKIVAQISSGRYFPIDIEGVVLPQITNLPDKDLPIISGLELNLSNSFGPDISKEKKIMKALELIKEIENNRNISNYGLKKIDISDGRNIFFYLGNGMSDSGSVEIKIGDLDFRGRLKTLQTLLAELGTKIREVRYIDLRFENPIVSSR